MPFADGTPSQVTQYLYTTSPLLQAAITFNAAAENAAIAAVAGKTIRIHGLLLIPSAAVTLTIKSGATARTGAMVVTTVGLVLPLSGLPYWTMGVNEAFVLSTTAIQVSGTVWYLQD